MPPKKKEPARISHSYTGSVSDNSSRKLLTGRNGIVNPRLLRAAGFWIIAVSTILCAGMSVIAIWDPSRADVVWRALATYIVIVAANVAVVVANEFFAPRPEGGE